MASSNSERITVVDNSDDGLLRHPLSVKSAANFALPPLSERPVKVKTSVEGPATISPSVRLMDKHGASTPHAIAESCNSLNFTIVLADFTEKPATLSERTVVAFAKPCQSQSVCSVQTKDSQSSVKSKLEWLDQLKLQHLDQRTAAGVVDLLEEHPDLCDGDSWRIERRKTANRSEARL